MGITAYHRMISYLIASYKEIRNQPVVGVVRRNEPRRFDCASVRIQSIPHEVRKDCGRIRLNGIVTGVGDELWNEGRRETVGRSDGSTLAVVGDRASGWVAGVVGRSIAAARNQLSTSLLLQDIMERLGYCCARRARNDR